MRTETYRYDSTKDVILLPGKIYGPTAKRNIRLVFDPGACRTIITTELTNSIGYKANAASRRVSTSSAIDTAHGYTITISRLDILGFQFSNMEVACFDLPVKYDIDGLLGLDILELFEVTLWHSDRMIQFKLLGNE